MSQELDYGEFVLDICDFCGEKEYGRDIGADQASTNFQNVLFQCYKCETNTPEYITHEIETQKKSDAAELRRELDLEEDADKADNEADFFQWQVGNRRGDL
jgi:hypothetical protein